MREIAKLSNSAHKNRSKNSSCGLVRCLISTYDNEKYLEWVRCNLCDKWIHLMCEVTPDRDIEQVNRMPTYECLRYQRFSVKEVFQHLEHQIEHLKSEKHSLEVEVLALSDICREYRRNRKIPWEKVRNNFCRFWMTLVLKGKHTMDMSS